MAFWIFKCNPDKYRLADRLADPNPTLTWTVSRFRHEINAGDTVFLWVRLCLAKVMGASGSAG